MAQYKVIQDVEAEDKLVGPLTFRQFVYALVAAGLGFLSYFLISHSAGFLSIPFIPIAMISAFFAWPWGRDQPTEVWALAKIRFYFKSRRRIWDQSGAKELVTVTAPKKIARNYTNGLSLGEVNSRLRVLADTIDSRGWVVRNVDPNSPNQIQQAINNANSDRLVGVHTISPALPAVAANSDVKDADDIMDTKNNPIARQFDNMITASAAAQRQRLIKSLQQTQPPIKVSNPKQPVREAYDLNQLDLPQAPGSQWFMGKADGALENAVTFNAQVVAPGTPEYSQPVTPATPTADEVEFIKEHAAESALPEKSYTHLHTIQPLSDNQQAQVQVSDNLQQQTSTAAPIPAIPPVTQPSDAAILDLASNNDLNVATIAREAQKRRPQDDEVVISLH
jgi:hypothetical protein